MTAILIISSTIAITVSFLCSLAESLLLSMDPLALNRLQATRPRTARAWKTLKQNIARPITAILVLNTIAHTGGATVAGGAFAEIYGEHNIWVFSILFTLIVLFGTEILPKVIGISFRNELAPWAGPVLVGLTRLLHPFILLSEAMFSRLAAKGESEQITTADLITLATVARSGKAINLEQENIIVNAVRLSHTAITTAMIPPERIRFLPKDATPEAILQLIKESGHTRYPLSRSADARDIYAYTVTKKVLPATPGELDQLITEAKPIRAVDCRATLMTGLHTMLQCKEHLLAVVDGQKRCVGIVTLEDIAGELLSADIEEFK
ncbi:MAG: CNNM domain-containing protein [Verrucomicrobia bacterium]|nr:CNNM domain-containing protein [Verrucomicrobiota bacterium]